MICPPCRRVRCRGHPHCPSAEATSGDHRFAMASQQPRRQDLDTTRRFRDRQRRQHPRAGHRRIQPGASRSPLLNRTRAQARQMPQSPAEMESGTGHITRTDDPLLSILEGIMPLGHAPIGRRPICGRRGACVFCGKVSARSNLNAIQPFHVISIFLTGACQDSPLPPRHLFLTDARFG